MLMKKEASCMSRSKNGRELAEAKCCTGATLTGGGIIGNTLYLNCLQY